ncbi:HAMP domain-containing sensor histidine kinase [Corticibacter populi]|uniref:HAMP domain-containing sensor histidine kinase n=1 Tax=Corticibacter populi TaxID=1550736 RepID=UPI0013EEE818|nr:HAMP domain-containing sensor histidine kinase [Corticibacter populi]
MFLLVTLASVISAQLLLEQVLNTHVKDMLNAEIQAHKMLQQHDSAEQLADTFRGREGLTMRRERAVAVQATDGRLLFGAAELLSPQLCADNSPSCTGWLQALVTSGKHRDHQWLGLSYPLPDGGRYIIAYDILPMIDRLYPIPLAAGLSILTILLASLWAGLYFSRSAVRRINRIRHTMRLFAHGDLQARVPMFNTHDEFDLLGQDVNRALTRIERLMEEVRNATNHIAHELRSPLTRLQQRLSNIAEAASDDPAIGLELELAEEETQHIQYLFRTVLRISEIETGRCQQEFSTIRLLDLFTDIKDYYDVLAERRAITLALATVHPASDEVIIGDRPLLFQALGNLVDNAIKYSPMHSTVTLIARAVPSGLEVGAADEGPGIDADLHDQAIQRFQRLNHDRTVRGHGLGLALVQAVAELHGGHLVLRDNSDYRSHSQAAMTTGLRGLQVCLFIPTPAAPVPSPVPKTPQS